MNQPPVGTVTFLFTDIEGSTKLWQEHPEAMPWALTRHHALLNESIAKHGGYVFQIIGDAFCAAFSTANDGLEAALDAQRALAAEKWGETGAIRVRIALHTGRAEVHVGEFTSGEYISGLTLSRAARLLSAGHGGQILLSLPTAELVRDLLPPDTTLRDLGARRLKDLIRPEQIFQVVTPGLPSDFAPLKTLDVHPHNLPVQLTSFIGREREMGEIKKLLAGTRLLTLTGIGGTGKTRLAIQASADLIDEFPGGVWLVELAPIPDPALVEQTVASVLGVHEERDCSLSDLLAKYVQEKHMLLILDNCEHLVEACAQIAEKMLHKAPQLKIMATSRVSLNLAGETTYHVQPLTLPDSHRPVTPFTLTEYEAVRLFIERTTAVQPEFSVTNANAPAVAQICTQLDGIPLAIELAAARIRLLSPDQITTRLSDRFILLTGGSRTALPRQQTLRATMDWSYDLLSETERTLFNRLGVFAGSFSLEAAEAICTKENDFRAHEKAIYPSRVLDLLDALVNHSLVSVRERNEEARYYLLETVRQYALEKLHKSGEWTNMQDQHLAYYLELAERGLEHVRNGEPVWIERFETEYDNLRVAMEYAIANHPESAILLEDPLGWFSYFSGRPRESYDWAMRILALTESWPPGKMRAIALWHAGDRERSFGRHKQGQVLMEAGLDMVRVFGDKYLEKSILMHLVTSIWNDRDWARLPNYANQYLEISQELDDKIGIQVSLYLLGEAACGNGEIQAGRMLIEQSLELARQLNNQTAIAMILTSLARLARLDKDNARAIALYTESAQVRRKMRWQETVAFTLGDLCQVYLQEGDSEQVRALTEEKLAIYKDLPEIGELDRSINLLYCLADLAGAAGNAGQATLSALLFGAVEAAVEDLGFVMDEFDHSTYDPIIATIRERLGEADFNMVWVKGRRLTLEQAIELAMK